MGPFLDFAPKVVCDIGESGNNKYAIYQNDNPQDFSGTLHNIGSLKMAVCRSEPFAYLWVLPNKRIVPIMKNEGSGAIFSEIQKFIFRDNYNLDFLRIHIYLAGAVTILMVWLFLKGFLDVESANAASILLAASLPFLNEIHLIRFSSNYIYLFQIIIIFLGWKYFTTQKTKYFYLLSLAAGLAAYIKLTIIWMIVALALLFIYYRPKFKLKPHVIVNGCLLFVIGCLPLLIYNVDSAGGSSRGIKARFLNGRLFAGINHVAGNIMANTGFFFKHMLQTFPLELLLLFASAFLFIYYTVKNKTNDIFVKRISFLWYLGFIMLAFIFISAYPGNESYYLNSYNFFIMPMAATLVYLLKRKEVSSLNKKILKFSTFAIIAISVFSVVCSLGRPGLFSPPSARLGQNLTKYLEENKIYEPVCFEYRLLGVIEYISRGKIRPLNYYLMFDDLNDYAMKIEVLKRVILSNPGKTFIISTSNGPPGKVTIRDLIYLSDSKKIPMYVEKISNDIYGGFVLIRLFDNVAGVKKLQLQDVLPVLVKTKL